LSCFDTRTIVIQAVSQFVREWLAFWNYSHTSNRCLS